VKIDIGMVVHGECGTGEVIAMTPQWCVYRGDRDEEFAEPWYNIVLAHSGPARTATDLTSKDLPNGG
jgi:hypothetical protein